MPVKIQNAATFRFVAAALICFGGGFTFLSAQEVQDTSEPRAQKEIGNNNRPLIYDIEKEEFVRASDDFPKVKERVARFKEENGKAPNLDDYYDIIFNEGYELTGIERPLIWFDVCRAQQPPISKEEIREIYLAKRDFVKDFYVDFTVEDSREPNGVKECRYAVKNNDMFLHEIKKTEQDGQISHRLSALNKSDFRYVVFSDSSADAGIQNRTGNEFGADGFCFQMPLVKSMIFDQTVFGLNWKSYDMPMLLEGMSSLQIMEKTEMYEGNECLIIAGLSEKFYLDIQKDYSVCCAEFFDEDALRNTDIRSVHPRSRRVLRNLVSYGNGIWLPSEVETTYYDADQNVTSRERIVYNEIRINQGLKDDFFIDVIPDGAIVSDSIRDMVYVWGDHPSIGSLIKETVKSKRQAIFRNLSVVCGLCFLACWGFIEWRKKRLLKENAE